jgi:serine/threonine-protein kinase
MTAPLSPERYRAIDAAFAAVVELDPEERGPHLARLAERDPELAAQVRSLLVAHLGESPLDQAVAAPPRSLQWVGQYRLLRELGTGGMGTVYLAERQGENFSQIVALKLLRSDFASPILADRLVRERQILARLEHPGIARFIDGGTAPGGQPFVAMEYVPGVDLLSHATAHGLSVRDRVRLMADVADAVHYAHSRLVVHRDLKPGNILVGDDGRVKLLDFGIGKILDEAETATEPRTVQFITPMYASPEQVRREPVTTSTDVYALGVVLFQLLTGRLPYEVDATSWATIEYAVCERVPIRPSLAVAAPWARDLEGDLDTIVLKALAKEPERRYHSADQLAEDLRRYLSGRPVIAQPDSRLYRARKFIARHRLPLGGAALAAAILLVTAGVAVWQSRRAERERAQAEAVSGFVIGLFEDTDPGAGLTDERGARQLLERGRARVGEFAGPPGARARMYDALGEVARNLSRLSEADSLFRRALREREVANEGEAGLATSLTLLGRLALAEGRPDTAAARFRRAITLHERSRGPADPAIAEALVGLTQALTAHDHLDSVTRHIARAVAIRTAAFGPADPATVAARLIVAANHRRRGQVDEAAAALEATVADVERGRGADHPEVGAVLLHLGDLLLDSRGDTARAEQLYRRGLRLREGGLGTDHYGLMHGLNSLAALLAARGHFTEAEGVLHRSIVIAERALGPAHPTAQAQRERMTTVLRGLGRLDEAVALARDVVARKREALGARHPSVAGSLTTLGDLLDAQGHHQDADQVMTEALSIRSAAFGEQSLIAAATVERHGELFARRGRHEEALRRYDQARAMMAGKIGDDAVEMRRLARAIERSRDQLTLP